MKYWIVITTMLYVLLSLVGCTAIALPTPQPEMESATSTAEPEEAATPTAEPEEASALGLELSPEAENAAMAVREMLMQELAVDAEAIEIVAVEAMDWPDACLGVAAADEMCAAVIVPGYQVTVVVDGEESVYRTNAPATNIRAEDDRSS